MSFFRVILLLVIPGLVHAELPSGVPVEDYGHWVASSVNELESLKIQDIGLESEKGWKLKTVVMGIAAGGELGVGNWKIGFMPRFRVVLSRDPINVVMP